MSEAFAGVFAAAPYLIGLLFNAVVAGVCFYGERETAMRGWRLMGIAAVIRVVMTLARLFVMASLRSMAPTDLGHWLQMLGIADFAVTPITAILTIIGLLQLLDDARRLRR